MRHYAPCSLWRDSFSDDFVHTIGCGDMSENSGAVTSPAVPQSPGRNDVGEVAVDHLNARLAAAHFWESSATDNGVGPDGDRWLIEGRLADRYWVVEKYCPPRDDAFGAAGTRFS